MQVAFDIDGVLRDFCSAYYKRFKVTRTNDWICDGEKIYDLVSKDYSVLVDAKPTKYLTTVRKWLDKNSIQIWSHQPKDWIPHTEKWLQKYFGNNYTACWLTPGEKYNKLLLDKSIVLVDDYPFFPSYDRIVLIDTVYNKKTQSLIRMKAPNSLLKLLNIVG